MLSKYGNGGGLHSRFFLHIHNNTLSYNMSRTFPLLSPAPALQEKNENEIDFKEIERFGSFFHPNFFLSLTVEDNM